MSLAANSSNSTCRFRCEKKYAPKAFNFVALPQTLVYIVQRRSQVFSAWLPLFKVFEVLYQATSSS